MRDEMKRMLVVFLIVDVITHIVQQSRIREQLAIARVELQSRGERVEQLQ